MFKCFALLFFFFFFFFSFISEVFMTGSVKLFADGVMILSSCRCCPSAGNSQTDISSSCCEADGSKQDILRLSPSSCHLADQVFMNFNKPPSPSHNLIPLITASVHVLYKLLSFQTKITHRKVRNLYIRRKTLGFILNSWVWHRIILLIYYYLQQGASNSNSHWAKN